jgi:G3E family GTPase
MPDAAAGHRKIVELLVNQVECADIVVLNKCDAIAPDRLAALEQARRCRPRNNSPKSNSHQRLGSTDFHGAAGVMPT